MSLTRRFASPAGLSMRGQGPHRVLSPKKVYLRLEFLEARTMLDIGLSVGSNVLINPKRGNQSETSIAINPTNPFNLFAIANDESSSVLFGNYSRDGGATWGLSAMAGLAASWGDAQTAWDSFGNLFVTYLNSTITAIVTVMSSDGGQTFSVINTTSGMMDQPSIAVGPSNFGDGTGSVWISYENFDANLGKGGIMVKGAVVEGLANVTSFTAARSVPGSAEIAPQSGPGNFGSIGVGPQGQVLVAYQLPSGTPGPAGLYVNLADGFSGDFGPPILATTTNVGGFAPITPQPSRSTDAEVSLAFDNSGGPHTGRVYMVYTDRASVADMNDTDNYERYSDNDGLTWSDRVLINDDGHTGKAQFSPAVAVDQSTGTPTSGFLAVTWYDCRDSPLNNSASIWGTVSIDGGRSFLSNVQISSGLINAHASDPAFDFGDYDTMDFYNGTFYRTWTDNTLPGHIDLDLATAPVTVVIPNGRAPNPHRNGWTIRLEDLRAGNETVAQTMILSSQPVVSNLSATRAATRALPLLLDLASLNRFFAFEAADAMRSAKGLTVLESDFATFAWLSAAFGGESWLGS